MTMPAVFDRSLEQRREALSKGNDVRLYRAALKRRLRAGEVPYDVFLSRGPHDPRLASMKVREALLVMPHLGPMKVDRIMRRAWISPSKTLGGLSPQAWDRLYGALEEWPAVRQRLSEASGSIQP